MRVFTRARAAGVVVDGGLDEWVWRERSRCICSVNCIVIS